MSVVNLIKNPDFLTASDWNTVWEGGGYPTNTAQYVYSYSNAYIRDHCRRLAKTVDGNIGTAQTVDFGYNVQGLKFKLGAWVKIILCAVGGGGQLSAFWYDDSDVQVGSEIVIDTMSAVQNYTLHSDELTAPSGAYKLKIYFKATGGAISVTAYLGLVYIFSPTDYGLLVSDGLGNNSFLIPDVATIVASGTVSLPVGLNADGTYGAEIDLPVLEQINSDYIGVLCQVRDFDWKAKVNILAYDGGNKFWGSFFGDSAITYYEKNVDTGVMTAWTAGAMTPGNQLTWDSILSSGLLVGWDRNEVETSKIRLFASMYYSFLKTTPATPATTALYARYENISVNNKSGYSLSTVQGSAENNYEITCPYIDYGGWWMNVFWKGPISTFDIYIVHSDGTEDLLASDVAYNDAGWNVTDSTAEGAVSGTWACPDTVLVTTDALRFVLKGSGEFLGGLLQASWPFSFTISFITGGLGWIRLNPATWTFTRYFWAYAQRTQNGKFRTYWGDASKEVKIEGINYTPLAGGVKNVNSIGSNGVSEVDYVVYLKNYAGIS